MARSNSLTKCFVNSLVVVVYVVVIIFSETSTVSGEPLDLAYSCIHMAKLETKSDLTPIILLHGLTDSRQTWLGFYQVLAMETGRRVCIADARNHGDSPWSDDMSLDSMTEDLERLMDHLKMPKAILLGHSMGGKTAMNLALKKRNKVAKLIVEDMRPNSIEPKAFKNVAMFVKVFNDSISSVPEGANEDSARLAIWEYINKKLKEFSLPPLPMENAEKFPVGCSNGTCRWKTNFKVIIEAMKNPKEFLRDMEGRFSGEALFIYGELSPFQVNKDKKNILELFPKAEFFSVKGASHSIHNHFPVFMDEVLKFLKSSENEENVTKIS